jgi:hypothetical protein
MIEFFHPFINFWHPITNNFFLRCGWFFSAQCRPISTSSVVPAMLSRHKTPGMPSLVKIVNICLVVISVAQIIHNERVKRDINNYKMETHQSYKIRHILIDHFRAVYMEQHMKFWLEHVKNHFLNSKFPLKF